MSEQVEKGTQQTQSEEYKTVSKEEQIEQSRQKGKETEQAILQVKPEQPQAQRFIEQNTELAETYKAQGNQHFKKQQYYKAIYSYQHALQYASSNQQKLRAILYSNISICLNKENDHKEAIEYCKKSIKSDPTYMKAHLNLALAYQKVENAQEALAEYKKIVQINPSDVKSLLKVKQLQKVVEQLNEKRKKEVIDGLKTIGNNVLGFFGLSLDNFKLNQTDNGGYNVSFKN